MNFAITGAVLSSVLFGAGDLVGGLAARRAPAMRVTFFAGFGAIAVLLVALPFTRGTPTPTDFLWAIAAGVCGAAGATLIYRSLALGPVSLASPVFCTLGLIVPVLVGLFMGERPSLIQWLGITAGIGALPLLSLAHEGAGGHTRAHLMKSLYVSVLAGLVIGWFLVCVARIGPHAGLVPLVVARSTSMAILAVFLLVSRQSLLPAREARGLSLGAGVLDSSANAAFWFAVQGGSLAIVSALVNLAPATSVLLARAFLGERWSVPQRFGLVLALASGLMISLGGRG